MKGREVLGLLASACGVITFIAGTAASTLSTGIFLAGCVLGGALVGALVESMEEARRGESVTAEALRGWSLSDLYVGLGVVAALVVAVLWDLYSRNGDPVSEFGLTQVVGLTMIGFGGWVIVEEWTHYQRSRHKECPDCARTVLAKARKCDCGYRFDTGASG